ncbi:Gustatory receptor 81b [Halyomorpha halys]|nr:Gustatory receptor 81b [Halyomorpha halys]
MSDCIIGNSLISVYYASKWLGLSPFTVNKDGYFERSLLRSILPFIFVVMNCLSFVYFSLVHNIALDFWMSNVFNFSCFFLHLFMPITEFFIKIKEFNKSIAIMKVVRNAFPILSCELLYFKTYILPLLAFLAIIILENAPTTGFSAYHFLLFMNLVLGCRSVAIIMNFGERFAGHLGIVTKLLKLCNDELSTLPSLTSRAMAKRLEKLTWAHHKLCNCATIILDIHGLQILLLFYVCFSVIIVLCYSCIRQLFNQYTSLNSLCYIVYYSTVLWRIISACEKCRSEAKKFNTLLYQLMIDDKTNEISENKKLRLHISMKREVVFSACGFFNLDYTLIHSMVAAATTYLVILIQFGQPMNNEVPPEHLNATLTTSSEVSNFFTTPSWIYTTI